MDNERLKQLFRNVINPDAAMRAESERVLSQLASNPDFVFSLPNTLMMDDDVKIRRRASVYFKNMYQRKWNDQLFQDGISKFKAELIDRMVVCDSSITPLYTEIFRFVLENDTLDNINEAILKKIPSLISSSGINENTVGIVALLTLQSVSTLKRDEKYVRPIQALVFPYVLNKFEDCHRVGNYDIESHIAKYISLVVRQRFIDSVISDVNVQCRISNIFLSILLRKDYTHESNESKRWALKYFYRVFDQLYKTYRGDRSEESSIAFVSRQPDLLNNLLHACDDIISRFSSGEVTYEKLIMVAVDFIKLTLTEGSDPSLVLHSVDFYLNFFILKVHSFDDNEEVEFNEYPTSYLDKRYNCDSGGLLRTVASSLFIDICKRCSKTGSVPSFDRILQYITSILRQYRECPSIENARFCYGGLSMVFTISHQMIMEKKGETGDFLIDLVFPLLHASHRFIQSQACYALQYFDGNLVKNNAIIDAFMSVMALLRSDDVILSVDAAHSIQFFFRNDIVRSRMISEAPYVARAIIDKIRTYRFETLSDTLEALINGYSGEILPFTAGVVDELCLEVTTCLDNYAEENMIRASGYFRNIASLLVSNKDVVTLAEIYERVSPLIKRVFNDKLVDIYPESIDVIASLLCGLRSVTDEIWSMFHLILSTNEDEMLNMADEIVDLIGSYVSFGGDGLLVPERLNLVVRFVNTMCMSQKEFSFDDNYNCGCRVIEVLLTNYWEKVRENINEFVRNVTFNCELIAYNSVSWVFYLNVIMECFVVDFQRTLMILSDRGLLIKFFERLYEKRRIFTRVHDKKVILLFIGVACSAPIMDGIDYRKLARVMAFSIRTLPKAISKRNKLIERMNRDRDGLEDEELYEQDMDTSNSSIEEDVFFETSLDRFDPFPYMRNILSGVRQGTIGEQIVGSLDDKQKGIIAGILEKEQPIQRQ